jgi:ribosomal protein S18 acetylase RimI-like enzyme
VSFLSNWRSDRNAETISDATGILCRLVTAEEVAPALRLVLSADKASDAPVIDFLRFALARGIDTNATYVAIHDGHMIAALLPVPNPGRTLLLLAAPTFSTPLQRQAAAVLLEHVLNQYAATGIHLVQILLDPTEREAIDLYTQHDFTSMAELLYLQTSTRRAVRAPELSPGQAWINYSPNTHALFARTIAATYQNSLDCPALAGQRNIEDTIAGHRATGEFDPALWYLLLENDQPLGVVLLAPTPPAEAMELVYLGLTPAARGRQLGDLLLRQALYATHRRNLSLLTLAVDSLNAPALKLYYRHGLRRVHAKVALMRDLRQQAAAFMAEQEPSATNSSTPSPHAR